MIVNKLNIIIVLLLMTLTVGCDEAAQQTADPSISVEQNGGNKGNQHDDKPKDDTINTGNSDPTPEPNDESSDNYESNDTSFIISSVFPIFAPSAGDETISIIGSGFSSDATVKIGSVDCTNVSIVSLTVITCKVPAASAGTYDVNVTQGEHTETLTQTFTYYAVLEIQPTTKTLAVNDSFTFSASGGVGPYTYTTNNGSITSSGGVFTAPVSSGNATVTVTDSLGDQANATITINTALAISPTTTSMKISTTSGFSASGGVPPYIYSVASGSGTLSGSTYTAPGSSGTTVVMVTDSAGNTDDAVVTIYNSGDLISTFDTSGIVLANNEVGAAIKVDNNNKIIVASFVDNGSNTDIKIRRINPNGSLDTSFATDGVYTYDGGGTDTVRDMALDINGNIVITGSSVVGSNAADMIVIRLTSSGVLDTTFNSDGIFTHHGIAGGWNEVGESVAIDGNGKIVVAGTCHINAPNHYGICYWRLTSSGSLDTSFSGDGLYWRDIGAENSCNYSNLSPQDLAIDENNNIFSTGWVCSSTSGDMFIHKLKSDGTSDISFGSNSVLVHNNAAGGNHEDTGNEIALTSDGKIYVVGYSNNPSSNYDLVIWRFSSSGELDTSFGTNGIVIQHNIAGGGSHDLGTAIILDYDENLYISGASYNSPNKFDFVIGRLNPNGSLDSNFGINGYSKLGEFNHGTSTTAYLAWTSDDNIVVLSRGIQTSPIIVKVYK